MSTVAEVTQALSRLTTEELRQVEATLLSLYRERKIGIIFDDKYRTFTEEDLTALREAR